MNPRYGLLQYGKQRGEKQKTKGGRGRFKMETGNLKKKKEGHGEREPMCHRDRCQTNGKGGKTENRQVWMNNTLRNKSWGGE